MSSNLIKIVDKKGEHRLEDVQDYVVKIGAKYYMRNSDKITYIQGRFYRKASPLVRPHYSGRSYILREEAIEVIENRFAHKDDFLRKTHDGKLSPAKELVNIKGKMYHIRDQGIIKMEDMDIIALTGSRYALKDSLCTLDFSYGVNKLYLKEFSVNYKGSWFKAVDCVDLYDIDIAENSKTFTTISYRIPYSECIKANIKPVVYSVNKDEAGYTELEYFLCDIDRNKHLLIDRSIGNDIVFVVNLPKASESVNVFLANQESNDNTKYVLARGYSYAEDGLPLSKMPFLFEEKLNNNIDTRRGGISGAVTYFKPSKVSSRPHFSQTKKLTGGIGYTFGIEMETVAGNVPNILCEKYGFRKIGDGSTRLDHVPNQRHYEYVSSVLHGDIGLSKAMNFTDAKAMFTLFSEKCSTHIHVGGNEKGSLKTDTPIFNRRFSAYAIKLGVQVESSLASLFTQERNPAINKYCSSISKYKSSRYKSRKDQNRLIASYVFSQANLDARFNSKKPVGKWDKAKYKWLNLINCNASNGDRRDETFKTIEFRIFPPTNSASKLRFYVLISLAFVWFVENRQRMIEQGGVTIDKVLEEAYSHSNKTMSFIQKQIEIHRKNSNV